MAAADGYRLAGAPPNLKVASPRENWSFRSKAFSEVARLITDEDDQVMVTLPARA
jgi:hypothetical protein